MPDSRGIGGPPASAGGGETEATSFGEARPKRGRIEPREGGGGRGPDGAAPLLTVERLTAGFDIDGRFVAAVIDVSFHVDRGETLCIVGESGSGKSVTALSILRLVQPPGRVAAGRVLFEGRDLLTLTEREMQKVRGARIALIFQEPMTALNPVFTIGSQIAETLLVHGRATRRTARRKAIELLDAVRVPDPHKRVTDYPHQLSGGLRQRALIAMSLACEPAVVIADEPTTALDVTIQAQILDLLRNLQQRMGLALVLITHDLGVVAEMADRVAVMYAGRIVEEGSVAALFADPKHPYTRGLMGSIPGGAPGTRLKAIQGTVPPLGALPPGCCFTPRCPERFAPCPVAHPGITDFGGGRTVKCYLHGPVVEPDVAPPGPPPGSDPSRPLTQSAGSVRGSDPSRTFDTRQSSDTRPA
jgi:oligopeptide/dipeptide ABC transporter ATP-binding protein